MNAKDGWGSNQQASYPSSGMLPISHHQYVQHFDDGKRTIKKSKKFMPTKLHQ